MEPIPDYIGDWMLARWMGVTKAELDDMPIHEVMEARITMGAIAKAEHDANKAQKKKGRRG